jgi:aldehyde:ferredoxin oxidoreductase
LDNAGYSLDQKIKGYPSPEELVDRLVKEECWRQVLSSLVVCFFARGIYKPEIVSKAFKPLGYEVSEDELIKMGEDIYKEKLKLKVDMGFKKPRIPDRIFETECYRSRARST